MPSEMKVKLRIDDAELKALAGKFSAIQNAMLAETKEHNEKVISSNKAMLLEMQTARDKRNKAEIASLKDKRRQEDLDHQASMLGLQNIAQAERQLATEQQALHEKVRQSMQANTAQLIKYSVYFAGLILLSDKAVEGFAAFDNEMRLVNTIAKLNETQFQAMSTQVRELALVYPTTAKEMARALYDLYSSMTYEITKTADAMKLLELSIQAAIAGDTKAEVAMKALTQTLNAYQMNVSEASHVLDVQFETVKIGVLRYEELANAQGKLMTAGQRANQSLEEVSGMLAFMTKMGFDAFEATTYLRTAMMHLADPGLIGKMRDLFGINMLDAATGKIRSITAILGELAIKTQGSQYAMRQFFEEIVPDIRSSTAFDPMIRNIDLLGKVVEDTSNRALTAGEQLRATEEMLKSAGSQLQILKNHVTELSMAIGKDLMTQLGLLAPILESTFSLFRAIIVPMTELSLLFTGAMVGSAWLKIFSVGMADLGVKLGVCTTQYAALNAVSLSFNGIAVAAAALIYLEVKAFQSMNNEIERQQQLLIDNINLWSQLGIQRQAFKTASIEEKVAAIQSPEAQQRIYAGWAAQQAKIDEYKKQISYYQTNDLKYNAEKYAEAIKVLPRAEQALQNMIRENLKQLNPHDLAVMKEAYKYGFSVMEENNKYYDNLMEQYKLIQKQKEATLQAKISAGTQITSTDIKQSLYASVAGTTYTRGAGSIEELNALITASTNKINEAQKSIDNMQTSYDSLKNSVIPLTAEQRKSLNVMEIQRAGYKESIRLTAEFKKSKDAELKTLQDKEKTGGGGKPTDTDKAIKGANELIDALDAESIVNDLLGISYDKTTKAMDKLRQAMVKMISEGVKESDPVLRELIKRFNELQAVVDNLNYQKFQVNEWVQRFGMQWNEIEQTIKRSNAVVNVMTGIFGALKYPDEYLRKPKESARHMLDIEAELEAKRNLCADVIQELLDKENALMQVRQQNAERIFGIINALSGGDITSLGPLLFQGQGNIQYGSYSQLGMGKGMVGNPFSGMTYRPGTAALYGAGAGLGGMAGLYGGGLSALGVGSITKGGALAGTNPWAIAGGLAIDYLTKPGHVYDKTSAQKSEITGRQENIESLAEQLGISEDLLLALPELSIGYGKKKKDIFGKVTSKTLQVKNFEAVNAILTENESDLEAVSKAAKAYSKSMEYLSHRMDMQTNEYDDTSEQIAYYQKAMSDYTASIAALGFDMTKYTDTTMQEIQDQLEVLMSPWQVYSDQLTALNHQMVMEDFTPVQQLGAYQSLLAQYGSTLPTSEIDRLEELIHQLQIEIGAMTPEEATESRKYFAGTPEAITYNIDNKFYTEAWGDIDDAIIDKLAEKINVRIREATRVATVSSY